MSPPPQSPPPSEPERPSVPRHRRRLLIAGAAALVAGGAIAVGVVVTGGGEQTPTGPRPAAPQSTVQSPTVSVPSHNPPQSPPWGFIGSGWLDLCYGPVATPGARKQQPVSDSQPCRPGSRRIPEVAQIALTARAGADVDRLEAIWRTIEPVPPSEAAVQGTPRFNWAPLVTRYRAMLRDGIRPIVVAYDSPAWARVRGWDRPGICGHGGCAVPPAPGRIPQWRAFLRGLMAHLPEMRALEIWNEPNYAKFFAPHPRPGLYVRMLRAADQAARDTGFRQPLITGGLSPVPPAGAKMAPADFLSRVYEIAGKRAFDGIGAHPYPAGPPWTARMTANLDQLRRVSARFGDGSKPLWITEVGLGGTPQGAGHFNVPLERQGRALGHMYRAAQGLNVRSFLIYTLHDSGGGDSRFGTYGVLTPALKPKPAYCYLAQHIGGTHACSHGDR
jgi:hypothetical protein